MSEFDQKKHKELQNNLKFTRIIWWANLFSLLVIYFIFKNLAVARNESSSSVVIVLASLAAAQLSVALILRRIRYKALIVSNLDKMGFDHVIRNFRLVEIISISLTDSIMVYGVVAFLLSGNQRILGSFAAAAAVALLYLYPRISIWAKSYNAAIATSQPIE